MPLKPPEPEPKPAAPAVTLKAPQPWMSFAPARGVQYCSDGTGLIEGVAPEHLDALLAASCWRPQTPTRIARRYFGAPPPSRRRLPAAIPKAETTERRLSLTANLAFGDSHDGAPSASPIRRGFLAPPARSSAAASCCSSPACSAPRPRLARACRSLTYAGQQELSYPEAKIVGIFCSHN